MVDRTNLRHRFDHFRAQRRFLIGIDFVNVETVGFPVFVQAKRKVETWLLLQPGYMRADFGALEVAIVPIEVDARVVLSAIEWETGWIQAGAQPEVRVGWPLVFPQQLA